MKRRFLLGCQTLVLGLCCGGSVFASDGRQVAMAERMRGAQKAVVATTVSVTPGWRTNANGDRLIVSQVALRVEETLKGSAGDLVWLDLEGGTIDGVTLQVSSQPSLKAGDRAVFLLDETPSGTHTPHLKGMGILRLDQNNQVSGSSLRLSDLRSMALSVVK